MIDAGIANGTAFHKRSGIGYVEKNALKGRADNLRAKRARLIRLLGGHPAYSFSA